MDRPIKLNFRGKNLSSGFMDPCNGCFRVLQNIAGDADASESEESFESNTDLINSIKQLPSEVLGLIFQLISSHDDRCDLRLVCQKWKDVMDSLVGIPMRIGSPSEFDPEIGLIAAGRTLIYHNPRLISYVGIDKLIVGNISPVWDTDDDTTVQWIHKLVRFYILNQSEVEEEFPLFLSPDLVYLVNLCGEITPSYFHHFLQELHWIKILSLSFVTLNCIEEESFLPLRIPTLEVLIIRGGVKVYAQRHRFYKEWDTSKILQNIMAITQNHFPKLRYAGLDYIYDINRGLEITKHQLKFLKDHASTIQQFSLEYCILLNDEFRSQDIPEEDQELVQITNEIQVKLELSGLRLIPVCLPKLPYCNTWLDVIKMQDSLEEFTMIGVLFGTNLLQNVVDMNFSTLKVLFIWEVILFDNQSREILNIDCFIFNKCTELTKLALQGWTVSLSVRNLINVRMLPESLVEIDLRDMAIRTEDVRSISCEMQNLKVLDLHFIGNRMEMGMTEAILRDIMQQRRIHECRIVRSLNGGFENPEGIPNGNEVLPSFITQTAQGIISFKLGPRGFYTQTVFKLQI